MLTKDGLKKQFQQAFEPMINKLVDFCFDNKFFSKNLSEEDNEKLAEQRAQMFFSLFNEALEEVTNKRITEVQDVRK